MPVDPVNVRIHESKRKLLDAAVALMLRQGYTATTVDQICAEAGLTKGSFFHCFRSKVALGIAAMDHFSCGQGRAFKEAGFDQIDDPVARLHCLFETMADMIKSPQFPCACVVGNLAQEMAQSSPEFRESCDGHFSNFVAMVSALIHEAKKARTKTIEMDAEALAWMMCSLLQGSLLIARTRRNRGMVLKNLDHFRAYLDTLLGEPSRR